MTGPLTRLATLNASRTEAPPRPRLRPRGLPPALEPHGVYTATNAADAALYGRDLFGTHRLRIDPADARSFVASYHAVLLRDVTLGYLDYGVDVLVEIRALPADQLVIVPATGGSTMTFEATTVATSPVHAVTPPPGSALDIACSGDTAHLIIRIDRDALCRHASRLLGRPITEPPRFAPLFDLTTTPASRWNAAIQMLHAELFDPGSLLNQATGVGQIEEFIMSSLLYSQHSDLSHELAAPHRRERPTVRAAKEHIDAHLTEPITIVEIARASDTTVRTLQQHFREDLGTTPTEYLRDARLDRARNDLADAGAGSGVTVADIATRWGLNHLGRFSALYRDRFGELPSHTLRH